jgi:hypothetical protein
LTDTPGKPTLAVDPAWPRAGRMCSKLTPDRAPDREFALVRGASQAADLVSLLLPGPAVCQIQPRHRLFSIPIILEIQHG